MVADSSRKNVAIRGLDNELYNVVFSMAKRDGKRVADIVNMALKEFVYTTENGKNAVELKAESTDGRYILRNNGEISLSKNDIISLKREVGPFLIENTGRIKFEKDIDKEAIKNIESIVIKDGTVEVPKALYPNFLVRSEIFGKLEKY